MAMLRTIPALQFGEALKLAWSRLTMFTGRSRRSEFWWTVLAVFILNCLLSFIPFLGSLVSLFLSLAMIPLTFRRLHDTGHSGWWWGAGFIMQLALLAYLFPSFMIALGDVGSLDDPKALSAALTCVMLTFPVLLMYFVCFVYDVVVLVFMCKDSEVGANKYGPSPKYVEAEPDVDFIEVQ